jgi:phage/plasmid-like protein (TIGR03299 family)
MPADFESGFFGGSERAWHGLGTVIPDDVVTAEQGLQVAGLDWLVEKEPLFVDTFDGESGFDTVEGFSAIRRQSDGDVLGVVGSYYRPVQNHEGFAFIDQLLGNGDAKFHTAGSLEGGRCVWMLARLPEDIMVAGEKVMPFVFFTNRHDGKGAVKAKCTPVRIVCANTLAMALGRKASNTWAARHLAQWDDPTKLAMDARSVLGFAETYFKAFVETGELLAKSKMTSKQFGAFLDSLIPIPLDADGALRTDRTANNQVEMRDAIEAIYRGAPNLENVRGTKWAAYNAVSEWGEWVRTAANTKVGSADENRFRRAMIGDPQGSLADKALGLLVA